MLHTIFENAVYTELLPVEVIVHAMDDIDVHNQLVPIDELIEIEHIDGLAIMPAVGQPRRCSDTSCADRGVCCALFGRIPIGTAYIFRRSGEAVCIRRFKKRRCRSDSRGRARCHAG